MIAIIIASPPPTALIGATPSASTRSVETLGAWGLEKRAGNGAAAWAG